MEMAAWSHALRSCTLTAGAKIDLLLSKSVNRCHLSENDNAYVWINKLGTLSICWKKQSIVNQQLLTTKARDFNPVNAVPGCCLCLILASYKSLIFATSINNISNSMSYTDGIIPHKPWV